MWMLLLPKSKLSCWKRFSIALNPVSPCQPTESCALSLDGPQRAPFVIIFVPLLERGMYSYLAPVIDASDCGCPGPRLLQCQLSGEC
jgi:hypothetical protein